MFKILFSPKWIALTLVVFAFVPLFKELSDWQWRRLDQRLSYNNQISSAQEKSVTAFITLAPSGNIENTSDLYRNVNASGVFLFNDQYLVRKKSLDSEAGLWVVTPFKTSQGQVFNVVRGWVAAGASASTSPELSKFDDVTYTISGRLRQISPTNLIEPNDLPPGQRAGIDPRYGDAYFELVNSEPALNTPEVIVLPMPTLTEGTHRSYAIQWLFFMGMLIIGYFILLRNDLIAKRKLPVV